MDATTSTSLGKTAKRQGLDGDMIVIDGSILEGGGQLVRHAVGLSALLGRPIAITNIRAKRSTPGSLCRRWR